MSVANPATNFDGYIYNFTDTQFLSALLLYHLLPGTPLLEALAVGGAYIAPTALQGHNVTQLENDEPQVIAFAAGTNGTIEVYNQVQTTTVLNSYAYLNLSIYEVNEIIGFPGSYSYLIESYGLSDLDAMRSAGGASSLDGAQGYTLFAPLNSGFDAAKSTLSSLSPADVWNNHVRLPCCEHPRSSSYFVSAGYHGPDAVLAGLYCRDAHVRVWLQLLLRPQQRSGGACHPQRSDREYPALRRSDGQRRRPCR